MSLFTSLLNNGSLSASINAAKSGISPISISAANDIHKAQIAAALLESESFSGIFICRNEIVGRSICRDINSFLGFEGAVFYPERDLAFSLLETSSREYEQERLSALCSFFEKKARLMVVPISAAMQFTISPAALKESRFKISVGESINENELLKALVLGGYIRRAQIDGVGQFSKRGGIIDIFCPSQKNPIRIELWGDEIDSISYFDIESQRRSESIFEIDITPARENLFNTESLINKLLDISEKTKENQKSLKENLLCDIEKIKNLENEVCLDKYLPLADKKGSIFDFLNSDSHIFIADLNDLIETAKAANERLEMTIKDLILNSELSPKIIGHCFDSTDVFSKASKFRLMLLDVFLRSADVFSPKKYLSLNASQSGTFSSKPSTLPEQIKILLNDGYNVVICCPTEQSAKILKSDLFDGDITASIVSASDDVDGSINSVYITVSSFSASFEYSDEKLSVISILGEKEGARKKRKSKAVFDLSSVSIGDYVVHSSHGIGVYKGIQKLEVRGIIKDYIKIQYSGSDVLYVPVTQLDMVAKYIGASSDDKVKLNKLDSVAWKMTKRKISHAVRDMAKELISLYSKRLNAKGFAFSKDSDWQNDFESRFPYSETPDQTRCIAEIKKDMESSIPMERLLCGDVGFGKTEVALRAAMKCVMDSKQCAILVPTTILALQHYNTALSRFDSFPINIAMLSGFRSSKEQKEILKRLERGEIDIIIGTHRLVQNDVKFKDLGLAIIDEEQRFGVAHKEKFKEAFNSVDMLTLSATPIPRTLNMSMTGVRDISMIEEAPIDRYPVQTFVMEYNYRAVIEAIERELSRGGQVYYIHNKTESIDSKAAELSRALKGKTVAVAHGKMSSSELEKVWKRLIDGEIDVLVCTTIIETGVDVSNCNTLIIEDADNLGLSQLYQLRGRVGRSSRRAYAYFTFRGGKQLTEVASKRLSAIRDFTAFGSGFQIALRDLEIRGAGNMLGAQQHGHMDAVGYDMYLKLLNEAILEEKGEAPSKACEECLIDIKVSAHIPNSYIDDNTQRIEAYRKIALIKNDIDVMDVTDELIDRYGEPPAEVGLLIGVALLRNLSLKAGIVSISQKTDFAVIEFESPNLEVLSRTASQFKRELLLSVSPKPYLSLKIKDGDDILSKLNDIVSYMCEIKKEVK